MKSVDLLRWLMIPQDRARQTTLFGIMPAYLKTGLITGFVTLLQSCPSNALS
jgi:hypothetical protein